jgi:hypothetical protein
MSAEMRLKLDRRIHNQRVALRENWMISERRANARHRYSLPTDAMKMVHQLAAKYHPSRMGDLLFALSRAGVLLEIISEELAPGSLSDTTSAEADDLAATIAKLLRTPPPTQGTTHE